MKAAKNVVIGVVIVLLVLGIVQNIGVLTHQESLKLNLLVVSLASPPISMSLLLAGVFIVGFIVAWVLGYVTNRRLKQNIRGLKLNQKRIEEELTSLRNLPVTDHASMPGGLTADREY